MNGSSYEKYKNITPERLIKESYASDEQDVYLRDFLFEGKRNGYFVDCGSADGLYKSNTFLLERDLGWKGICIEGRGKGNLSYEECIINRSVKCFNAVLGSYNGQELPWNDTELTGSSATERLSSLKSTHSSTCPHCSESMKILIHFDQLLQDIRE